MPLKHDNRLRLDPFSYNDSPIDSDAPPTLANLTPDSTISAETNTSQTFAPHFRSRNPDPSRSHPVQSHRSVTPNPRSRPSIPIPSLPFPSHSSHPVPFSARPTHPRPVRPFPSVSSFPVPPVPFPSLSLPPPHPVPPQLTRPSACTLASGVTKACRSKRLRGRPTAPSPTLASTRWKASIASRVITELVPCTLPERRGRGRYCCSGLYYSV